MKQRLQLKIQGVVQGVGFRPFIYRLATELELTGWVKNSSEGVLIEVEGVRQQLDVFLDRLKLELPPLSKIQNLLFSWLPPVEYKRFAIESSTEGEKTVLISPDISTCSECLQEIFAHNNRRYRYPFTNCTNCGPRFSIIKDLPYDRPKTTMKEFAMCDRCRAEYQNPLDRRFHAQPNACPQCGPHLELWDREGKILSSHHDALLATAEAIRQGKILAIKGLSGFHLVVDARNEVAVQKLRDRKKRPDKPFALMYPSLELIKAHCHVSTLEEKLLLSPEAPIVLLKIRTHPSALILYPSAKVTPKNHYLGIMLPYTPLHHLLLKELSFPVVATSGNLTNEPICFDNQEALSRLNNIADLFLVHNRPIARPVDDSIVRVMGGRKQILRRARGYAPLPIKISGFSQEEQKSHSLLAVGGQLKNTIAFLQDSQIFISQYVGDLETLATFERFQQTITDFQQIYELKPVRVAGDLHPHYLSTQFARQLNLPFTSVQHHYAHVLSCMADNELNGNEPFLGVAWDGTGYGLDDTIWGGEFLAITDTGFERVAHLQRFKLPGGEKAIKEPKRIALALLYEVFGEQLFAELNSFAYLPCIKAFSDRELNILRTMLSNNINTPITSSAGRLFDGIASILDIRQQISYEGQAAIELELAIADLKTNAVYNFGLIRLRDRTRPIVIDWKTIIREILIDIKNNLSPAVISAKFHNTLVATIVAIAKNMGRKQIILTGGCWQNKYLTERTIALLRQENFIPYWHHRVPCNDSGIALGQIVATLRTKTNN